MGLFLKALFAAVLGWLSNWIKQLQRDEANKQAGRQEQADLQAEVGREADKAVEVIAAKPPSEDEVLNRLNSGSA